MAYAGRHWYSGSVNEATSDECSDQQRKGIKRSTMGCSIRTSIIDISSHLLRGEHHVRIYGYTGTVIWAHHRNRLAFKENS